MKKIKLKKSYRIILTNIFLLICFLVFINSLSQILIWFRDNHQVNYIEKEIIQNIPVEIINDTPNTIISSPAPENIESDYYKYIKMPFLSVSFTELLSINPDTVGYINVGGTNINYPIVYSGDNDYYLSHDYQKQPNRAGWIFLDYRNNLNDLNSNTIIYGHSRINKTVFGTLQNVLTASWQNTPDNYVIRISTPKKDMLFQIFSAYEIPVESYYLKTVFTNDTEYQNWLDIIINRSILPTKTEISPNDKILTLSTCTNNNDGRIVVHAKLLKTNIRE